MSSLHQVTKVPKLNTPNNLYRFMFAHHEHMFVSLPCVSSLDVSTLLGEQKCPWEGIIVNDDERHTCSSSGQDLHVRLLVLLLADSMCSAKAPSAKTKIERVQTPHLDCGYWDLLSLMGGKRAEKAAKQRHQTSQVTLLKKYQTGKQQS